MPEHPPKMMRVIYVSRSKAAPAISHTDLLPVEGFQDECRLRAVTGAALSCGTHIIHILEGLQQPVTDLLVAISNDERQERPMIVEQQVIQEREFSTWSSHSSAVVGYFERCIDRIIGADPDQRRKELHRLVAVVGAFARSDP